VGWGTATRRAKNVWARDWALPDAPPSDYAFLVDRLIDRATLDRAEALAKKWGVLPHAVMIANGWLSESDYYRALARASGVPFQDDIAPHEVTAPASLKSPRACLAPRTAQAARETRRLCLRTGKAASKRG
jgi:hypothetical protein